MSKPKVGVVLLVHGSRKESWVEPFAELARELNAASRKARYGIACLQFGRPDLEAAAGELAAEGVGEILVVPFFLSSRGHVQKDIPRLLRKTAEKFPGLRLRICVPLGEEPEVQTAIKAAIIRLAEERDPS